MMPLYNGVTTNNPSPQSVDIVVPVYNEANIIERFHQELCVVIDTLPYRVQIYYVNDGSSDHTQATLTRLADVDSRVIIVELSRNFGHQAALTAGIALAQSDVLITMDGDGQHPAQLIPEMIVLYRQGYDIVLSQRTDGLETAWFKRTSAQWFYRLINRLGDTRIYPGCADFRLISHQVAKALKQMPEYHRFLRGMIPWMGFRSVIIPYLPANRLGGESKYSLRKMLKLSADAIFSFSLTPLYLGLSFGIVFFILAFLEIIYVLNFWIRGLQDTLAPGWSSLMFVILIVGGIQMIVLGFIGIYLGYIFQEVKHRPIYLVRSIKSSAKVEGTIYTTDGTNNP